MNQFAIKNLIRREERERKKRGSWSHIEASIITSSVPLERSQ